MSQTDREHPFRAMSEDEAWERLRQHEFGRLAFHLVNQVSILPLNYHATLDHRLLFRTHEGSKLMGIVMNPDVAFEIDGFGETEAWSVIVQGSARRLEENELATVDLSRLHSWVPTLKYDVIELVPTQISGREFFLERPWVHTLGSY